MAIRKLLLAATVEDISDINYPVLGSAKIDGIRGNVLESAFRSRSGKTFKCKDIPLIYGQIIHQMEDFDGEFVSGSPTDPNCMQKTTSCVNAYENPTDNLTFYVFDYIDDGAPALTRYRMYTQAVENIKKNFPTARLEIVEKVMLRNEEELLAFEEKCLEEGYEGIMLQPPEGLYKHGRSSMKSQELMKLKRFTDGEMLITDFYEQMHNANEAEKDAYGHTTRSSKKENMIPMNTLGGFIGIDMETNKPMQIGSGRGLTKELRQHIWDNKEEYRGKISKYKHFNKGVVTKARFPIHHAFRDVDDMGVDE